MLFPVGQNYFLSKILFNRCANGNCVVNKWLCDGDDDCMDGSDEDLPKCGCKLDSRFKCEESGACILSEYKCDKEVDCADRSDERSEFTVMTLFYYFMLML